jgi:hypothetical protein
MSQVCIVCAHLLNWDSINTRIVCEIRQDSDFEQCGSMYTREAKAVLPIQASCVHTRGKSCAPNTSKLCTLTREKLCSQYKQAVYTHEGKAVLPIQASCVHSRGKSCAPNTVAVHKPRESYNRTLSAACQAILSPLLSAAGMYTHMLLLPCK